MTLEDFFTLTEIKDGLASIPRVDDLVSIMKKEKDDSSKNLGDAARQWATVGGVLASTESMDCLNRFIQLDGIHFLHLWLQEAQKSAADKNENYVNESVDIILQVLENLPIETTWPTDSGINVTIENFSKQKGMHQERAQCLLNNWNREFNKCADTLDNGKQDETCSSDDKIPEDVEGNPDENGKEGRLSGADTLKAKKQSSNAAVSSLQIDPMFIGDEALMPKFDNANDGSAVSKEGVPIGMQLSALQESVASVEESSTCQESATCPENIATASEVKNSPSPRENGISNSSYDVSEMEGVIDDKEMEAKPKFGEDTSSLLNEQRSICALSETEEKDLYVKKISSSSNSGGKLDRAEPCRDPGTVHVSEHSDKLPISPDRCLDSGTSSDKSTGIILEKVAGSKGLSHESNLKNSRLPNPMILCKAYKPNLSVNCQDNRVSARSQMDLDEGEDTLEVPRIVGKEVEREVVDYREPSGSFSGKCIEDGNAQPGSLDSVGHNEGGSTLEQLERVEASDEHRYSVGHNDLEGSDCSPKAKRTRISSATNPEVENLDAISTHSIDCLKDSIEQTSRDKCMFDLNEDVLQEETECQMTFLSNLPSSTLSAPVPVIPVSKGCGGIPVSPLHFEGEHGWKGIAATSAFRRASPRRTANGDRLCLGETSSQDSKRKNNVVKFDLNVVETEEEPVVDSGSIKHLPVSSGLLSGESSVEVSSRNKRLRLDLNRIEDHDEPNAFVLPERRVQGREFPQLHQNGNRSPSSASSSSSRQPSTRDFDLNDNPSFFDPSRSHGPTQYSSQDNRSYASFQFDKPFISIMGGSRMEVDRKELDYQTHIFLPSAPSLEPSTSGNVDRLGGSGVGISYAPEQPPPFSYNELTMWPAGAFPPPVNNHAIPYMVDSRGASVMPSIMGGTGTSASPALSRPPFFMSVLGPSPSMIGGAPQSGFDMNAGMGLIEGENQTQEVGGLKHLFVQGHGGLIDEQMKSGLLLGGAGLTLKRKEPECGWEHSMPGYKKHETSWQH